MFTSSEPEPVAVIGISCRLPGDIRNPSDLWDLVSRKRSTFTPVPPSRFNHLGFYHPTGGRQGSLNIPGGHFITSPSISTFDASFFGIQGTEANSMDPQQRMLLECVWECLESGGIKAEKLKGERVGVYVGAWTCDYADIALKEADVETGYWVTGGGRAILSNRISYLFDFQGPSMTLDTGCSASGMALHVAVQSLLDPSIENRTHSCIVGGTNLFINPEMAMSMSTIGVLSPTGPCKTFDAKADGYARGEGINCLYLKRLSDALRDGDPVRALIRASAINSDGRTLGLVSPSSSSQEACIREAYSRAKITDFSATGYFECHGTGTAVGDPAEVGAVGRVFCRSRMNDDPLYIGSIKTNLGHGEGASALSGVIKGIVSLEGDRILPNINFEQPNSKIHFDSWKVKVPTAVLPWPRDKAKRVSVSCYGYGGANFHVILESLQEYIQSRSHLFPNPPPIAKRFLASYNDLNPGQSLSTLSQGERNTLHGHEVMRRPFLITFSAKTDTSIKAYISNLFNILSTSAAPNEPAKTADLAYTLCSRRSILPVKAYGIFSSTTNAGLAKELQTLVQDLKIYPEPQEETRVGFIFTGQGAQWAQMGLSLRSVFPVVEVTLQKLQGALSKLSDAPEWSIITELSKSKKQSRINEPQFSQVLCTAVQISLVDLLYSWNIKPRAVVGHSSGEIAAAYASGALSAEDAITVAYYRGKICSITAASLDEPIGGMLSVGLGREEIGEYLTSLQGKLVVSCINSPSNVTISGDVDAIEDLQRRLDTKGGEEPIFNRRLKVPLAYHSHHMVSLGEQYQALLEEHGISTKAGVCPIFSSVTAEVMHGTKVKAAYWRKNLESPVRFSEAVQKATQEASVNTLIEIGPHSALSSPIREIRASMGLEQSQMAYIPTLIRGQDCVRSVLELAGRLFCEGYTDLNLEEVNAIQSIDPTSAKMVRLPPSVVVDIPNYFWDHSREYWFESRRSKEWRFRKHPRHDLLGSKVTGTDLTEWQWMNVISANTTAWLKDHRVRGSVVMPAVGYVAMAVEALTQVLETRGTYSLENSFHLRDININKPLMLDDHPLEIYTTMRPGYANDADQSKYYEFCIRSSAVDGEPVTHCSGVISSEKRRQSKQKPSTDGVKLREVDSEKLYKAFAVAGFDFGKRFRAMKRLRTQNDRNVMWAEMLNHNLQESWQDEERSDSSDKNSKSSVSGAEPMSSVTHNSPSASGTSSASRPSTPQPVNSGSDSSTLSSLISIDSSSASSTDLNQPFSAKAANSQSQFVETPFFNSLQYSSGIDTDMELGHIDSRYPVHPINLDMPIQLTFASMHAGRLSTVNNILVPILIEDMYISTPSPDASPVFEMYCEIEHLDKTLCFDSNCTVWDSTGQEVIRVSRMLGKEIGAVLQVGKKNETDHFRLEWVVDWDFVDQTNFKDVVEQDLPREVQGRQKPNYEFFQGQSLVRYMAAEMLQLLKDIEIPEEGPSAHFRNYRAWLEYILSGGDGLSVRAMSSTERQREIELLASSIRTTPEGNLNYKIYKDIVPLAQGSITALNLLSEDGLFELFDSDTRGTRMSLHQMSVVRLFSQKYAKADVLQIGGGSGGATQAILNGMTRNTGLGMMERCYGSFTWTDSDSSNVKKAKNTFSRYAGINFATLDISKEPAGQGFGKTFDVIYAFNALHSAGDIATALKSIAKLLRPGGKVIVTETLGGQLGPLEYPFIMGTLPTWWHGTNDEQGHGPLLCKKHWLEVWAAAGFVVMCQLSDFIELEGNMMVILTYSNAVAPEDPLTSKTPTPPSPSTVGRPSTPPSTDHESKSPIILLNRHGITPAIESIGLKLALKIPDHEICHMNFTSDSQSVFPQNGFFISLMELDDPLLTNLTETELARLQELLSDHAESYILWVTSGAHLSSRKPELALISGFGRALRNELGSFRFNILDISSEDVERRSLCIYQVYKALSSISRPGDLEQLRELDWEFCEFSGIIYVPRLIVDNKTRAKYGIQKDYHQPNLEPFRQEGKNPALICAQRGLLSSMVFKDAGVNEVLEEDHVEVRCEAWGLNFKDVATAMGLIPFEYIGTECSGTVLRVGKGVTRVIPGDRVMCISPNCFMSKAYVWEGCCLKIPEALEGKSLVDIMASNVVFVTAIMGLMHVARMRKGESVLIHSAAGGVGLAAIQIAKMIGAEIFATCGSPEKRKFLIEKHGIPDSHIFSSRDTSFSDELLTLTKRRGADVVLNSLTGDLLQESWRCIAKFGRFVEIGKRDMIYSAKLCMREFLRCTSFTAMDLGELWLEREPLLLQLMEETLELLIAGKISPVHPIAEYCITDTEQAFRYMSAGTHTGKIVITAKPEASHDELVKVSQGSPPVTFDPRASYLLVGGLGGIGSSLAVWMAENGARHLCLMTRSGATTAEAKKALRDLEAMDCRVQLMQCDVGDSEAVDRAIQAAEAPIRGVIHAAMSLKDGRLLAMTHTEFKEPLHAKVTGLMNLHRSLLDQPLKFFVVLSSLAAVLGNPGQTNYTAAGTFQDAFARYRHRLGLPATSIDLGMVTEIGYLSRNSDTEKRMRGFGFIPCDERQVHKLVQMAIDNPAPELGQRLASGRLEKPKQFTNAQLITGVFITGPAQGTGKLGEWFADPKWSIIHSTGKGMSNSGNTFGDSDSGFSDPMRDFENRPAEEVMEGLCVCIICRTAVLAGVPREEIKKEHSLKRYGMDSLVAVEMKNWLLKMTTVELAVADILVTPSIGDLAEKIYARYKAKLK